MQKEQLIKSFSDALHSDSPCERVNSICRDFLKDKIDSSNVRDQYVKNVLLSIAEHFSISFEFAKDLKSNSVSKPLKLDKKTLSLLGITGVAGGVSIVSHNALIRVVSCGIMLCSSLLALKHVLDDGNRLLSQIPTNHITTTPDAIYIQLKQYEGILDKLVVFNSLDSYDIGILTWLQNQYCESNDENYKRGINIILEQSGYEFVDYGEETKDYFDSNIANVEKPTTTYMAIRSKHSSSIVKRGHILFPIDN